MADYMGYSCRQFSVLHCSNSDNIVTDTVYVHVTKQRLQMQQCCTSQTEWANSL